MLIENFFMKGQGLPSSSSHLKCLLIREKALLHLEITQVIIMDLPATRALSHLDPAAAASLATAPAVTEGANTALKDGGGGGSGTSGFLRAALRPGKAQRGQEGRRPSR